MPNLEVLTAPAAVIADETVFRANFDLRPFSLEHGWSGHPLFELPRLVKLAEILQRDPHFVAFDAGDIRVDHKWNHGVKNPYTLRQAMENIDRTGAWVILKHTETAPEYREVMEEILCDIEDLSGMELRNLIKNAEAQIMIASPNRVTPYHFDNECNVLLQLAGEKDLYVFDQADREVLTEQELEQFWAGDWNAGEYKARCQDRAQVFRLAPGKGAHIPVNAPHWVKNDDNVSVSLSVNFEWRDESRFNVYRANYFLRKLGVIPNPPGASKLRDRLKSAVMAAGFVPARNFARESVRWFRRVRHERRQGQLEHVQRNRLQNDSAVPEISPAVTRR